MGIERTNSSKREGLRAKHNSVILEENPSLVGTEEIKDFETINEEETFEQQQQQEQPE